MGYIGNRPTGTPLTSSDLQDGIVTNSKLGTDISANKLTAGTLADARFPATLPSVSGANLTNLPGGGKLLATQYSTFTSQTAHSSTSFTSAGYNISITPSATNSKIYVSFNFRTHNYQSSGSECIAKLAVFRQINGGGYSQFYPSSADVGHGYSGSDTEERTIYEICEISFVDTSHNTTNQIDYLLYASKNTSSSGSVNVGGSSHQANVKAWEIAN